jgi:hypothetical protein
VSRPSKSSLVGAFTAFPQNGVKQWEITAARYMRFCLLPLRNPLHNVGRTIAPRRKSICKVVFETAGNSDCEREPLCKILK